MMFRRLFFIVLFAVCIFDCYSQNSKNKEFFDDSFYTLRDSLDVYSRIILENKDFERRFDANKEYSKTIENLLAKKNSFYFDFDNLRSLTNIKSSDNKFRFLCWLLPKDDGTFFYNGLIQFEPDKNGNSVVIKLSDSASSIVNPNIDILNADRWYGAIYYEIIAEKYKNKVIYILIGWRGNAFHNKKVIDILTFKNDTIPIFGSKIFSGFKGNRSRILFQYNKNAVMMLKSGNFPFKKQGANNYTKGNLIIFDRLSTIDDDAPTDLAPMGSYIDGIYFDKGRLKLTKDVLVRSKVPPKKRK